MSHSITDNQLSILNSFTCERLSSNPDHLRLVDDFTNLRNEDLETLIKSDAFENDSLRNWWESLNFGEKNKIGVKLLWHLIVPKIIEITELIGVKYISLKAVDNSEDLLLVNHYKSFMGFDSYKGLCSVWAIQEYGCHLLSQEISEIKMKREMFYNNFNLSSYE